jgi:SAM-dependent methyltransferase
MRCRICDKTDFSLGIDLGMQPRGNGFLTQNQLGKEPFYPLRVIVCNSCKAAQLDYTVKKEIMFQDHTYLSGITRSLENHFQKTAETVNRRFCVDLKTKSVLDIGSNDGTQLKAYQHLGFDVLGVEPAQVIAHLAIEQGIPTLPAFFNLKTADYINQYFDVINASGVFFHLEELHSVTEAIKKYLKKKGVFVVQFLYMKTIMENGAFDQIYHEHLLFYTLKTLQTLLSRHQLFLFDAEFSPIHGGSMIGYVGHPGEKIRSKRLDQLLQKEETSGCNEIAAYHLFSKRIEKIKQKNLSFLDLKKTQGKKIFGMGAPVKGNTLLNYFQIGTDRLECLVEKNELRRNLFSPGMHLPVRIEREIAPPDVYYVLAWNFKEEILKNNQHLIEKGVEFFFPLETS